LERVLEPGLYRMFDPLRELAAEVYATVRAEFPADRYAVLKVDHPDLATTLFEVVETGVARSPS
jgi:2-oxo-4-hydroxy-4-carboxy--5-ureidoimidazoline (OHCU) decarboxylase